MSKDKKLTISEIIWLFVIGCLIGFVLETLWHFIKNGVWINKQGLLYGPFKPIYGFGLIIIMLFMNNFKDKKIWQKFIIGVLVGSAFEYFGSLFQEYVFGTSTWNYSRFNYNIGGRIYLPYCLAWGVIAIICTDFLYPKFKKVYEKIPKKTNLILTSIIGVFMAVNITLTVLATVGYANRANNIATDSAVFKMIDKKYPDEYIHKKFPKLRVVEK